VSPPSTTDTSLTAIRGGSAAKRIAKDRSLNVKVAGTVSRSSQPCELPLQQVDVCDVTADVVVAASLAGVESEPAPHVRVANAASAQVDYGREVLTLLYRGGGDAVAFEHSRDRAIE